MKQKIIFEEKDIKIFDGKKWYNISKRTLLESRFDLASNLERLLTYSESLEKIFQISIDEKIKEKIEIEMKKYRNDFIFQKLGRYY